MKPLNQYIKEKLIINKDYVDAHTLTPKSFDELREIIEDRYEKLGPGTKQNPIDFNDIDVSNIDSFYNYNKSIYCDSGLFERTKFKYIDISDWDVSNVKTMRNMFQWCKELKSVGDISKWDVSKVIYMNGMFSNCYYFNQNISGWDVSSVTEMQYMFYNCKKFNQDLSKWNVYYNVKNISMFDGCPIKNEYKPKF